MAVTRDRSQVTPKISLSVQFFFPMAGTGIIRGQN
jgi:hypothetical protein